MKTKIIFTINNLDTAGMRFVLAALVEGIDKQLFTPVIVVNKKTGSELEKALEINYVVHEIMLRNRGVLRFFPDLIKNVRLLKQLGTLAHSFDYSSDWNEALATKLSGITYIVEKTNLSIASFRWKIKLRLADHIVCLSNAQAQQLKMYVSKLTVIPTGVDVKLFDNAAKLSRADFGLSNDDVIFISVAHLVDVKGYQELILAIAALKDEFKNIKVVCIGKGDPDFEQRLKELTIANGVNDRFIFTGSTSNVAGWLKTADIKILATQNRGRREAFGAAIVEAMAAGLPVLATRSGGPEDIVVEGTTGWLINGDGTNSLIQGIRNAMNNQSLWKLMGDAGKKRAQTLYNDKQMINAYTAVYNKMISA